MANTMGICTENTLLVGYVADDINENKSTLGEVIWLGVVRQQTITLTGVESTVYNTMLQ